MQPFPRTHISRYVSDLEATIKFYNRLFQQNPSKRKINYVKYELSAPALIISFIQKPDLVKATATGHFGIQLETKAQLLARYEIAKSQGIVSYEEMGVACCYAIQDKFWAVDPDGHQWEIYYLHESVEFNDPAYDLVQSTVASTPIQQEKKVDKEACGCGVGSTCC